jgi:hypothetical protein
VFFIYLRLSNGNVNLLEINNSNPIWCFLLLLITILFIGLRDPYTSSIYFGDTGAYTRAFESVNYLDINESKDIGFSYFMKYSSYLLNINLFYSLCAFLYVYPVYVTFKKWFTNFALYALTIYVASMSFWTFGINGVRNGLSVSFFIFSLGFMNKKWLMCLIMLLSISFHKSMFLPVVVFFMFFMFNITRTNVLIMIWLACIALSYMLRENTVNFINPLLSSLLEDKRADIYSNKEELEDFISKSFRFDFVLYSAAPIVLGWYYKNKKKYSEIFYDQLLNTYIITNSVWILFFMFAPFTNRFAYLSWCLMPVLMIYPLLKTTLMKNQYQFISYLILGNLVFTLIMFFK